MKIEFLLLPEYGEQSERKNGQIPFKLFFPGRGAAAGLAAMQRGNGPCYIESSFSLLEPAGGT